MGEPSREVVEMVLRFEIAAAKVYKAQARYDVAYDRGAVAYAEMAAAHAAVLAILDQNSAAYADARSLFLEAKARYLDVTAEVDNAAMAGSEARATFDRAQAAMVEALAPIGGVIPDVPQLEPGKQQEVLSLITEPLSVLEDSSVLDIAEQLNASGQSFEDWKAGLLAALESRRTLGELTPGDYALELQRSLLAAGLVETVLQLGP